MNVHKITLINALLLAGFLAVPLIFSGNTLAAPLKANGTATPMTVDATQSVAFTCTPQGGTAPYTYSWAFGDGGTSTLQNPSHVYNTKGTYTATVTVTDNVGATDPWTSGTITVNALPTVTGTATPTTITATQSVSFTSTPAEGSLPFTFVWDFGDGTSGSTAQNVSHIYALAGTFRASITITDAVGKQASWTVDITVNAPSTVAGTATPTTIDATQTVQFTCSPSYGTPPFTYSWVFGDGGTSDLQNPSHAYAIEGSYTVNVTAGDTTGWHAYWETIITVNAPPTVAGTATLTTVNSFQIVSFTSEASLGTAPYTYSWDFGGAPGQFVDDTAGQSQSPSYEFRNPGPSAQTYTVTVTATDSVGMQAFWAIVITVDSVPSVTGTAAPLTIDCGQTVSFSCAASFGSGVYESYLWAFGDGPASASTDPNAIHAYIEAGSYNITIVVTDSLGARAVWTVHVTVNVLPSVTATATPTTIKLGKNISFTCSPSGGTGPFTYLWSFGDGSTSSSQSPDHGYAAVGTYTVNLTITDATNEIAEWTAVITVNEKASGFSLMTAALAIGAIVAVSAIILVLSGARRRRRPADAVAALEIEDGAAASAIAGPMEAVPIEPTPTEEIITPIPMEDPPVASVMAPAKPVPVERAVALEVVTPVQDKPPFIPPIAVQKKPPPFEQPSVEKKVKPLKGKESLLAPIPKPKRPPSVEHPPVTKARIATGSTQKICPFCTYKNHSTAKACEICGTKLK